MSGILNLRPNPVSPECRESFTSDLTGEIQGTIMTKLIYTWTALKAAIQKSRIWTFYKPLPAEKSKFQVENKPKNQGKATPRSNAITVSI